MTPIREQAESGGPQLVIWGTDVVVSQCKTKFCRFINQFLQSDEEDLGENMNVNEPFYLQELQQVRTEIHKKKIFVNYSVCFRLLIWRIHS